MIWLKKLRVLIDLPNSTCVTGLAARDVPFMAIQVDYIDLEPTRLRTFAKDEPVHMRSATVLYPNAADSITLLTLIASEIGPKNTRRFRALFRSDHRPGVKHCGAVLGLRAAQGEDAALASRAVAADPALMALRAGGARH